MNMGVARAWFKVKVWSDRSENKIKRNAFLPFILKEHGFGHKVAKESHDNVEFAS